MPVPNFGDFGMSKKQGQVTVPLDPQLRAFVEQQAAREDRTLAGQIRHLVAEARRRAVEQSGERAAA
jgi:hypothetical protein